MTTVAYRDGVMVADSRASGDGVFKCDKITVLPRLIVGICGNTADSNYFVQWLHENQDALGPDKPFYTLPKPPRRSMRGDWFDGLVIWRDRPDLIHLYSAAHTFDVVHEPHWAIGSGGPYARAAMHCGRSAEEAVTLAAQLDTYTALPLQVVRVEPPEIIKPKRTRRRAA